MTTNIVFTTLAMNQTLFFEAVGQFLRRYGYEVTYICFHERSHEYLIKKGAISFNAFELGKDRYEDIRLEDFGCSNINMLLSHEKTAFELSNTSMLLKKFKIYLCAASKVFEIIEQEGAERLFLIQELGGFTSLIAAFYAARARNIDNIFVEPSFFRGRMFFIKNKFSAISVPGPNSTIVSAEVNDYLDKTIRKQNVVIPVKDAHHYRGAVNKIFDLHNLRRLIEKSIDKYFLAKKEEFSFISGHVRRYLKMVINSIRLKKYYRESNNKDELFIYYPLHVPNDIALTLRSPEYIDQYSLIDFICRAVPFPYKVAIKEHPAMVGAVNYSRIRNLHKRHDNLIILDAKINNYQILNAAKAVITVNSKSGAEGLLLGKPVLVLGDAFYKSCTLVKAINHLADLPKVLLDVLENPFLIDQDKIRCYFQDVWDSSYCGELYDLSEHNIKNFSEAVISVLLK